MQWCRNAVRLEEGWRLSADGVLSVAVARGGVLVRGTVAADRHDMMMMG